LIYAHGVKHVARFWLRRPSDLPEIQSRIEELTSIPQVIETVVGAPLDTDWGRRIEKSYDVAFIMTFRTLEDCRTYFEDSLHQRVALELQQIAERVEAFYVEY
jgi:stress responsive alpha/beta barrel protein